MKLNKQYSAIKFESAFILSLHKKFNYRWTSASVLLFIIFPWWWNLLITIYCLQQPHYISKYHLNTIQKRTQHITTWHSFRFTSVQFAVENEWFSTLQWHTWSSFSPGYTVSAAREICIAKSRIMSPWLFCQPKLCKIFLEGRDPFVTTPSQSVGLMFPMLVSCGTRYVATHLARNQTTACRTPKKGIISSSHIQYWSELHYKHVQSMIT